MTKYKNKEVKKNMANKKYSLKKVDKSLKKILLKNKGKKKNKVNKYLKGIKKTLG